MKAKYSKQSLCISRILVNKLAIRFFLVLALIQSVALGQCLINDFFPVKHGSSKFAAIVTLSKHSNIEDYYERNQVAIDYSSTPEYLNGDIVRRSTYSYKYKIHDCILGYDNEVDLDFADDKLFKMTLNIFFKPESLDKCLKNYNLIIKTLLETEKYSSKYTFRDSETKEQKGEGYSFSPYPEFRPKVEEVNVGYSIVYETNYNSYLKETIKTGKILYYLLSVETVNLNGTKLDNRGY